MIRIFRRICLFLTLLLIAFSVAPAQRKGKAPKPAKNTEPAAATVNGQKIPYDRYLELYRDQANQQRKIGYDTVVDLANADAIFLQLVDESLLAQEAAKRGISVTREQVLQKLLNEPPDFIKPPFTDHNGIFHEETFRSVVRDPRLIAQLVGAQANTDVIIEKWKKDLDKVIRYVQNQELRQRVGASLYAGKPLTDLQIRHRYFAERTTVVGSFIRVLHSTIPDSLVPVTEEECRAWYDSHRNDYSFASARYVSSLVLPIIPLSTDSAARRQKVDAARLAIEHAPLSERSAMVQSLSQNLPKNRFDPDEPVSLAALPDYARPALAAAKPGDVIGPFNIEREQVLIYVEGKGRTKDTTAHARHILVKPGDATQDSLIHVMFVGFRDSIKTEEDFIRYARIFGQDATAANGGDLGYFGRKVMLREFDSAVFKSGSGGLVGPVTTRFGQHLIWVNELITEGYKVRELRFPLEVSPQAAQAAMNDVMLYADALRKDSPSADSLLLAIKRRNPEAISDSSLLHQLDTYGDALAVTNFAFNAKPGEVAVIRLPFDRIAAAKLLQAWPSGIAEYAAIRENYVVPHVRRAKQLDMLKPRVDVLRDSMTPDMTLGFIRVHAPLAEAFMVQNQLVSSPPDEDPTLLDSLIEVTAPGSIGGPVRGKHAYYFFRVQERTLRPREEEFARDRATFSETYKERYRDEMITDLLKKKREDAEVVDLRPDSAIVVRQ